MAKNKSLEGASAPVAEVGVCCVICGKDLTPTPEQLAALVRFGNPLRREPCLLTENGIHRVDQAAFDRFYPEEEE